MDAVFGHDCDLLALSILEAQGICVFHVSPVTERKARCKLGQIIRTDRPLDRDLCSPSGTVLLSHSLWKTNVIFACIVFQHLIHSYWKSSFLFWGKECRTVGSSGDGFSVTPKVGLKNCPRCGAAQVEDGSFVPASRDKGDRPQPGAAF